VSDLASMILKRILDSKKQFKECPKALKIFACTLFFLSPKAYEYVRDNLILCLPNPSTIRSWYQNVNGSPGISTLAHETIRQKVKETEKRKKVFCGIQMNDMTIKQGLQWDGKKVIGYVDFGEQEVTSNDENGEEGPEEFLEEAKNACVVMCTCINGHWKIPISYYLIAGMKAKERAEVMKNVLIALHETGLEVISFTFDGTSTNF
jgi:hypothetical protein